MDIAAERSNKEILEELWGCGREMQVNLKDELLLAKGRNRLSVWDNGAFRGNKEILESLWRWVREVQLNLKDDLLLGKGWTNCQGQINNEWQQRDFRETAILGKRSASKPQKRLVPTE